MNSKKYLFNEAERLYIYDFLSIEELSNKLHLNRKTIASWRDMGEWDKKKQDFLKSKQAFHEELYEFARKLMQGIYDDMEAGEKINQGRMYALCKILPMFVKVKDYEDITLKKPVKEEPRGLNPALIAQIEEEVLGIRRNDETE